MAAKPGAGIQYTEGEVSLDMDLQDNQTAAALYFGKAPSITKEEASRFLEALREEHQNLQKNGTEMWKLYVIQSAILNVRRLVMGYGSA